MGYPAGSLLTVDGLAVAEVARILALTDRLQAMPLRERAKVLQDRRIALLFYESSTRTRTSFELAAKSLGATTTLVSDKSSSIEKGETLKDTGLTLRALGAECIILRHPAGGAPFLLAKTCQLPVLNAGDGMHQHPSQALLDLRTMVGRLGLGGRPVDERLLAGVTVVITGDIRHSRVARSNAMLLPRLGAKVVLCGPVELLPEEAVTLGPGVEIVRGFDVALGRADVAMMLRIQRERLAGLEIDLGEYVRRYQLTRERLAVAEGSRRGVRDHVPGAKAQILEDAGMSGLKPGPISGTRRIVVMHPGPMIRGLEIEGEVADSAQSAIEEQVTNGLAVRAALLVRALGVDL